MDSKTQDNHTGSILKGIATTKSSQYEQRDYTLSSFVSFDEVNLRNSTTPLRMKEMEHFSSSTIEATISNESNKDEVCIIY